MSKINLDLNKFPSDTTLVATFHITREFKIRLWLATVMLHIIAKVLGCSIRFEEDKEFQV